MALIDRLVKAGYVVREDDLNDRRRQMVRIQSNEIKPIQAVLRTHAGGDVQAVDLLPGRGPGSDSGLHQRQRSTSGGMSGTDQVGCGGVIYRAMEATKK